MHLIDVATSGQPPPSVLPPEYIPPTFRRVRSGSGVSVISLILISQRLSGEPVLANTTTGKGLSVTFEDKQHEHFERDNLELKKQGQALLNQKQR